MADNADREIDDAINSLPPNEYGEHYNLPGITDQPMGLTREEHRRSTALIMAIKYHTETIIKDGTLYNAMKMDGKNFTATSVDQVLVIASRMERYIEHGLVTVKEVDGRVLVMFGDEAQQPAGSNEEESGRAMPEGKPEP